MIAEHVIAQGSVRVESLARIVGVSAMTIYRDVANLEQAGIVHLDRGMVRAVATSLSEADAEFRLQQSPRIKQAMAEALAPRIAQGSSVMLDDSTSAVDTKTDSLIRSAFETEIPGTTTIIIAQRLSSVSHADQIIVLDDGRIKERGTHEELMAAGGEYREIYDSQNAASESEVA